MSGGVADILRTVVHVLVREVGGAIRAMGRHLLGRLLVLALAGFLFVGFILLTVSLLPLTRLGIPQQAIAAFAGGLVLVTPWVLFVYWWLTSSG